MLIAFVALFAGLVLLAWGGDLAVRGASMMARRSGLPPMWIGLLVLGFGSSAPELAVALTAAVRGHPALALGSAWGANIVAMSLVLGMTAWVAPLTLRSRMLRRELPLLLLATLLTAALVIDGVLSRLDSGVLLMGFLMLLLWSWRRLRLHEPDTLADETQAELPLRASPAGSALVATLLGWIALACGSVLLVWGAVEVAVWLGVSDLVMGLSVLALGTTLPELAACVIAARKGEDDIALGHVLGAGLFNTLAVAGLAGLVEPLDLPPQTLWRDLLVMALLAMGLWLIGRDPVRPAHLGRRTGQLLIIIFALHTLALLLTAGPG